MAWPCGLPYGADTMKTIHAEAAHVPFAKQVESIVKSTDVLDVHTHLCPPAFSELLLWGVDELLVYHYLVAEVFRYLEVPYEKFWALSKTEQADLIWKELFVEHSPISEACRGVLTTLHALGLEVKRSEEDTSELQSRVDLVCRL